VINELITYGVIASSSVGTIASCDSPGLLYDYKDNTYIVSSGDGKYVKTPRPSILFDAKKKIVNIHKNPYSVR
jgi:hypothetical protein